MTEINQAVITFRAELEKIESPDVQTFATNALGAASDSFIQDEQIVTHTKKVFKLVSALLEKENTKGMLRDIMLLSVLLSDICINELPDDLKYMHPVAVKKFLIGMEEDLPQPVMEGLLAMIEGHEAEESPSKALEAKPGTPQFIISFANRLVRFDFIEINL